jgi:transmembrane sensor
MTNGENNGRYEAYGVPDFICDPFFQDWIIHPEGTTAAWWEDWMINHPEKNTAVTEARQLLQAMYFQEHVPSEEAALRSLAAVREKLATTAAPVRRISWWWAAAASLILCAGLGYFITGSRRTQQSYATDYAELRTLYLPDSSKMVLNAHSTVRYAKEWKPGQTREIWLDGEAFFDVRSVAASSFQVHTKDLTVEVLGTAFDIRGRRGKTEVVLQSGKIRISFTAGGHSDLVMAPGDRIVFDPATAALTHTTTTPDKYTSWKDRRLTDATLGEILQYLEDNYHKTFILEDPSMAERHIGGVILLDNLDDALFALSTVLNANLTQHQDTITIRPR